MSFTTTAVSAASLPPSAAAHAAGNDDPAKVAAARDFLLAFRPKLDPANASRAIDKMMPGMVARAKADDPKLDVAKFEKQQRQQMLDATRASLDMQSHVVSRHFTVQELKGLQAFYSGGLGKKLLAESPGIGREMMREKGSFTASAVTVVPGESKAAPTPPKKK